MITIGDVPDGHITFQCSCKFYNILLMFAFVLQISNVRSVVNLCHLMTLNATLLCASLDPGLLTMVSVLALHVSLHTHCLNQAYHLKFSFHILLHNFCRGLLATGS